MEKTKKNSVEKDEINKNVINSLLKKIIAHISLSFYVIIFL